MRVGGFFLRAGNSLGVDSVSILFNHPSFQQPDPFSLKFRRFSRKKDPWKEWTWKVPLETGFDPRLLKLWNQGAAQGSGGKLVGELGSWFL